MTSTATLAWFARHELKLAWRDWAAMMAGGRTTRERAITIGTLVFAGLLHWLAYALLAPLLREGVDFNATAFVTLTAMLLFTFSMMLSQAIEQVTRAFYARADLDLILSSPAKSRHLFAVRIAAIAVSGTAMTSLLAAPVINTAAFIDGPHWLFAYAAIAAMGALATGLSVIAAVALFKAVGAKRTRLIAQIIAAVVGAALLIGIQIVAVLYYGNLSRFEVLRSAAILNAAPNTSSLFWLPARAMLGDPVSVFAMVVAGFSVLAATIAVYAPEFSTHAILAAGASDHGGTEQTASKPFAARSTLQALRAKEWMLLRRDPWLLSQTLMQVLYLIPPALLCWRDMGAGTDVHIILAPVLVMAFGQLAGGLSWLAISGEDAPDLVATAPLRSSALLRAKTESVLAVIGCAALPLLLALAYASPWGAFVSTIGIAAAGASAITIQTWFKVTATRSQFRRRQTASKAATFAEAFSSIFLAAATGFAAAQSWFAVVFIAFALLTLWIAWLIRPKSERG